MEASKKKPASRASKAKPATEQRKFKGQQEIMHDLFRLKNEEVKKDIGWNPDIPKIERFTHKHFFHTVDSDGKKQMYSTPALGHVHKIEVEEVEGGVPKITVGPAVVLVKQKKSKGGGRKPASYKYDQHTHEVEYVGSEQMQVRTYSEEALKVISQAQSREASLNRNPAE